MSEHQAKGDKNSQTIGSQHRISKEYKSMKENLNTRLTILHDEIDQFKLKKTLQNWQLD